MLKKATGEKKDMLQQLYNETLKDKNAIIEALNEEQKQKIKEETDYNPLTDLRMEVLMKTMKVWLLLMKELNIILFLLL